MTTAILALAGCAATPATPAATSAPSSAPATQTTQPPPPRQPPQSAPQAAPADGQPQQRLAQWLVGLRASALAAGIRASTLTVLDDVEYLPRVVELDRAQPEFTRPVWAYLDNAIGPARIASGQEKLLQVQRETAAASARYGVPAEILVAIWGMESNYGGNYGNTRTIDALATLGVDGRREDWARRELMAALKILDNGDIDPAHMVGSWAGAMGQTQFMPSNFLAFAVDADGDGRRDIWGSMADVMASTGNFLARAGWQAGSPWGGEVKLPPGFDYARADASARQSSVQWAAEGVQSMDGSPLPALTEGEILLPAGARGPAFLVGPNFRTILRYNNSTSYALAVGLLARQLAGGSGVIAAWPRDLQPLSRSQVVALQTALNQRGFAAGNADGVMGPSTRRGVRGYQQSIGLPADGYPTTDLLARLQQ
ncbi:MAG: lytic murein transglycosylase [Pseudomonadota bacterium]